jgi:hypothetical protein
VPTLARMQLRREIRPYQKLSSGSFKSEREFLDFVVNNISLWQLCKSEGLDNISSIWLPTIYTPAVRRLLLLEPGDFPDGRTSLYVCAECGDIGCGAVSVRITRHEDVVTWSDFGYQNNYDETMTRKLNSFAVLEPVTFEFNYYRNLLLPLIGEGSG